MTNNQPSSSSLSENSSVKKQGQLVFVGTGISLAGQMGELAKSYICHADIVFSLVTDGFTERYLQGLNPNLHSLQAFYAKEGEIKNRRLTYQQMVDTIMQAVREQQQVVCALYGHPGVFACVSHMAISLARREGFDAKMLPGISAEACMWADLGIDPGYQGHQSYEATQFLLFDHVPDPTTHLVLWQIALAGEHTLTKFTTSTRNLTVLVEHLMQWYPSEHQVIIYEAATLPIQSPRIDFIPLEDLPKATLTPISTLLIPPARKIALNNDILAKLDLRPEDIG